MVETFSLCGPWTLEEALGQREIPAQVPGSVLHDLLENGLIPDPFQGENEYDARDLFDRDYAYTRSFQLSAAFLAREHVTLYCQGLDTLATVYINGQEAGQADNMHRSWRFDVKRLLRSGENRIRVVFASPNRFLRQAVAADPEVTYEAAGTMRGNYALRKAHCMFGWDWGPQLPDAGIWRPLELESWNGERLREVRVRQRHHRGHVTLEVTPLLLSGAECARCRLELMHPDGACACGRTASPAVPAPWRWSARCCGGPGAWAASPCIP